MKFSFTRVSYRKFYAEYGGTTRASQERPFIDKNGSKKANYTYEYIVLVLVRVRA